jgi:hypothetical protein
VTTEYALVSALIVLACLGALASLQNQPGNQMTDLSWHMNGGHASTVHGEIQAILKKTYARLPADQQALLQSDFSTKLVTLGANGTTDLLATQLTLVAQALKEIGAITEAQSEDLLNLANQGHTIAQAERLIEDSVSGKTQSSTGMYTFQGKEYTLDQLAGQIGFGGVSMDEVANPLTSDKAEPVLANFQSLYTTAQRDGSLEIPEVKALVDQASSQILTTGELVEDVYTREQITDDYAAFKTRLASNATNASSGAICTAGRNTDTGQSCR